jgi:glycosyltransferase involved in cell wall biosynthesis
MLFKFNRRVCDFRQCTLCELSYARPPQWWRHSGLLEAALRHVDAFLPPSRVSMALHQKAGLKGRLIHLPEFAPSALASGGVFEDRPPRRSGAYFLFAGRLEKLKGIHTLIPFFQRQSAFRLLIAGSGPEEPALRALAQEAPGIEFLGRLSRHDLSSVYRAAIAVLVPSLCIETFSLVTVEAFQQRTPVIARNLGGPAELIGESGGGIVYDTEEELHAAVSLLGSNPALRDAMGNAGYRAYQKNWTEEIHLKRYLSIVSELGQ